MRRRLPRPYSGLLFALIAFFLLAATHIQAAGTLTLGPDDGIALDQPRVSVAVVDPTTQQNLGPEFSNSFLLDTGANDILIGGNAYGELQSSNYQTVGQFDDVGIGGTATMDVSKPYEFNFAGDDGVPIALPNTQLLSNPDADLGFDGVVGTPAMMGRTIDIDMSGWSGGNFDTLKTSFLNTAPPVAAAQYHVPLTLQSFPPTPTHPGGPVPTTAPLSTAPVVVANGGHTLNAQFIVDTGAQISIISTATAAALGIDPSKATDSLDLSGIAGTVTVPVVDVASLAVKTTEGVNLTWTDLQVGVYDIDPSIAGIFGMDFLTSGWLGTLLGGPDGYLNHAYFDFRNPASGTATMVLDVNPALNHVSLTGDLNHDNIVNSQDLALVTSNWLASGTGVTGDVNGDGIVNAQDLALISSNWLQGTSANAAAVPEPSASCLILLAAIGLGARLLNHVRRGQLSSPPAPSQRPTAVAGRWSSLGSVP
ncbi:MAG TPA: aspartyl protease family protein [Pirellulales bacterium]|nr:aspartyl protease family protein [Pirellulales bacterium]